MNYSYLFKYIIIGDSAVGKSCLLLQFTDHRFKAEHDLTIGVEFGSRIVQLDSSSVKIQIWDTVVSMQAGMESFRSITRGYYRGAAAALIVYDVTNRSSYRNVKRWLEEARQNGNPNLIVMLVGNKTDLASNRTVSSEEGKELARENNLMFIEASALSSENVDEAFLTVARRIFSKVQGGEYDLGNEVSTKQKCGVKVTNVIDATDKGPEPQRKCSC